MADSPDGTSNDGEPPPLPQAEHDAPDVEGPLYSFTVLLKQHSLMRDDIENPYRSHATGSHAALKKALDRRERSTALRRDQVSAAADPVRKDKNIEMQEKHFRDEVITTLEVVKKYLTGERLEQVKRDVRARIQDVHGDSFTRDVMHVIFEDDENSTVSEGEERVVPHLEETPQANEVHEPREQVA